MATIFGRQALPLTQVLSRRRGDAILGLTGGVHAKVILSNIPPGVKGRMKMPFNILLDEVLSGRPQGTPLRPIILECLKRGEEGRRMLIALRDGWQTGINDIGTPRLDTISPVPEGIPLLEAERIAREREPGDGSPQKSVVEQIENALTTRGNQNET